MADPARAALAEHRALTEGIEELLPRVDEIAQAVIATYDSGGRLFTFGNGGSAADAQHVAAELVGRYLRERRPLAATALSVDPSVVTCIANDYSFDAVFARQVRALARPGDLVVGFTTSGRSENVVRGLVAAREAGAATVVFTGGADDTAVAAHADLVLAVPSTRVARIQEMHLLLVHLVVEQVDAWAEGS
ncbi:MAG: SIS domain-containing protein [Gaiellaceae bacterium]